ncbi:hypothetical protein EDD37DRAFT_667858 [Exophiala viscosa]|uniref:uncharacterized protein n=1 Tax=Exophiala viscosa TaxID=2486360 RepID=UPI0021959DE6|nr:hypothetical protein EDD37DRAFT_667858 [Exophiala viscosa]
MGRWGHRMFEGDTDRDLMGDVNHAMEQILKAKYNIIEQDQLDRFIEDMTKDQFLENINNISVELFQEYRQKKDPLYGVYPTVILGAVMMTMGANISPENITYLREAANKTASYPGYRLPIGDLGFRDPGKAQFLAALDHYRNGEARDFHQASCFYCGRINKDLNPRSLMKCGRCKEAWYCDQECQRSNWKNHKLICRKDGEPPMTAGGFGMLNV